MKNKSFTIPDAVTMLNLIAGTGSVLLAARGYIVYSALAIIAGVFFDFIDGKVARVLRQESSIGEQLDSLADLVTFGIAPAFLIITISRYNPVLIVLSVIFICCGAYRLARFNALKIKGEKDYIGVPITLNGIVIPVVIITGITDRIITGAYLVIISYLMVSSLRIKLKK